MSETAKARLAVIKLSSCDGCQLSLLDCEDELLAVAARVDIAHFLEASSRIVDGPYDLTLVEGSVSTPEEIERVREIRRQSRYLVTIGACATAGGIQALRNFADVREYTRIVYAHPEYIRTLDRVAPVADIVPVDYELRGCPINKRQLLELILAVLHGRRPNIPRQAVCAECKLAGAACLAVVRAEPCMGPVTQAGCGALCPTYDRGCFGCYGPKEGANPGALAAHWAAAGVPARTRKHLLRNFNAWAEPFREESRLHDDQDDQG